MRTRFQAGRAIAMRCLHFLIFSIVGLSAVPAIGADNVCAPPSMVKIVATLDAPDAPADAFIRKPKTLYRQGEQFGRTEELPNPASGLHLLIVVSEPDMWTADLASGRGQYDRDPGPTYHFRARIFGGGRVRSAFINALEFGCEVAWLHDAGAIKSAATDADFGNVDVLSYMEGNESLALFLRAGVPVKLELRRRGVLDRSVKYVEYTTGLPLKPELFVRPAGITFAGAAAR